MTEEYIRLAYTQDDNIAVYHVLKGETVSICGKKCSPANFLMPTTMEVFSGLMDEPPHHIFCQKCKGVCLKSETRC